MGRMLNFYVVFKHIGVKAGPLNGSEDLVRLVYVLNLKMTGRLNVIV